MSVIILQILKKDLCTNIEKLEKQCFIKLIHNAQCSTMLIDKIYTLIKYIRTSRKKFVKRRKYF